MPHLKSYFQSIMRDEKKTFARSALRPVLSACSLFYGIGIRANNYLYKANIKKGYKAGIPVISVGNITLGGTGKTPFVEMIAYKLNAIGLRAAVLIRGYGEDEWKMLEENLKDINAKVFVGRDRIKNIKIAEKERMTAVVMDDGFQHRKLKRDIDIVLVDSNSPFGNGRLFPRGVLREPVACLKRASIIVFTKVNMAKEKIEIFNRVKSMFPEKIFAKAAHKPAGLIDVMSKESFEISYLKDKEVTIFSAICDPGYFKHTIETLGARVKKEFVFQDHYLFQERDIAGIIEESESSGINIIITTEKDAVKLKGLKTRARRANILKLCIKTELVEGEKEIDAQIHRLLMRYSG